MEASLERGDLDYDSAGFQCFCYRAPYVNTQQSLRLLSALRSSANPHYNHIQSVYSAASIRRKRCHEPKYNGNTCFATLKPSNETI